MILQEPEATQDIVQRLQETEDRFRVMADASPVMLWMSGIDTNCYFFNKPWLDFTGRTLEQEVGTGWSEGVYFEDFQHCLDTYLDHFNARTPFRMRYCLRRHDGKYRWLLDSGVPRYSPDGTFMGFIGSCIDIQEMVEAHEALEDINSELKLTNRKLAQRNDELESFSYSVPTTCARRCGPWSASPSCCRKTTRRACPTRPGESSRSSRARRSAWACSSTSCSLFRASGGGRCRAPTSTWPSSRARPSRG